ncbi:MAG: hypothetical protein NZ893_02645 [Candidatus Aenigmarchaeota archaeon]|nr:hypothetical protein [Candidatus Aenigmarchaeota archaeon]
MDFIVFKKYNRLWAIPSSQANKPQIKSLLEKAILVEIPKSFVSVPKVYKIKKVLKPHRYVKREYRPMPLGLQKHILMKKAQKYGVASDILDWDVLDSKLSYSENEKSIMQQIKSLTSDLDVLVEQVDKEKFDYETRKFIDELVWKWESGDFETFKEFGIDRKKIKSKDDLMKLLLG